MYSTVRGTVEFGEALDSSYWVQNLREPVMFRESVLRLIRDGFGTFIEISPHPLLTTSIQAGLAEAGREGLSLPSLKREEDERASLLASAGSLYVAGHPFGLVPSEWSRPLYHPAGLPIPTRTCLARLLRDREQSPDSRPACIPHATRRAVFEARNMRLGDGDRRVRDAIPG